MLFAVATQAGVMIEGEAQMYGPDEDDGLVTTASRDDRGWLWVALVAVALVGSAIVWS